MVTLKFGVLDLWPKLFAPRGEALGVWCSFQMLWHGARGRVERMSQPFLFVSVWEFSQSPSVYVSLNKGISHRGTCSMCSLYLVCPWEAGSQECPNVAILVQSPC